MAFSSLESSYFSFIRSFLSFILLHFQFASLAFTRTHTYVIYLFDLSVCLSYSLHGHSFQMKRKQIRDNVQNGVYIYTYKLYLHKHVFVYTHIRSVYDVSIARFFVSFCFYHVLRYLLLLLSLSSSIRCFFDGAVSLFRNCVFAKFIVTNLMWWKNVHWRASSIRIYQERQRCDTMNRTPVKMILQANQ